MLAYNKLFINWLHSKYFVIKQKNIPSLDDQESKNIINIKNLLKINNFKNDTLIRYVIAVRQYILKIIWN